MRATSDEIALRGVSSTRGAGAACRAANHHTETVVVILRCSLGVDIRSG